ncbi:MAG: hypothetical protein BGO86_11970 [Chryseobacterium sp. 36-9]|nr:MAG: hypothetical protein BGO86_11970 [Chryseobacterium sp. 36-9]
MKTILFSLSVSFLILFSCKQNCQKKEQEIKTIMKSWYKNKIIFPKNVELLSLKNLSSKSNSETKIPNLKKYTIVHFFTADCDKCVNELKLIISSIEKHSENNNIDYIFIASAPTNKYVIDAIKETKFPYPIYYEKEYYSFKKMNNLPINDEVYNTMILNQNQEVVLFGGFYANEKAQKLFNDVISCGL